MRAKLGKKIFYEGTLVKNLWNHLDDKWRELHKDEFRISDKGQMSPDLVESRNQYIESIDPQKLRDILDQWANDFEELAAAERDEQEKKDMYDSIDAVRELQNRMANW